MYGAEPDGRLLSPYPSAATNQLRSLPPQGQRPEPVASARTARWQHTAEAPAQRHPANYAKSSPPQGGGVGRSNGALNEPSSWGPMRPAGLPHGAPGRMERGLQWMVNFLEKFSMIFLELLLDTFILMKKKIRIGKEFLEVKKKTIL